MNSKKYLIFIFPILFFCRSHASARGEPINPYLNLKTATIVWDKNSTGEFSIDQESFFSVLESLGFHPRRIEANELTQKLIGESDLLIIPAAAAIKISPKKIIELNKFIKTGALVICDGATPILEGLELKLSSPTPVEKLTSFYDKKENVRWPDNPSVPLIVQGSSTTTVLYSDQVTNRPMAITGRNKNYTYLYMAPLFDPISGAGYSRFPDIPYVIVKSLGLTPLFRREMLEAYFDPGLRPGINLDQLTELWHRWGVRAVYAASWEEGYDYKNLIEAAHRRGILVYAWLEWPHISISFWNQHPRWREHTVTKEAQVDWRYLMNLKNADCLKAALDELDKLLVRYKWDGVNVAEIYFESPLGQYFPDWLTPMNDDVRNDYRRQFGFDPLDLFRKQSPHYWEKDEKGLSDFFTYRRELGNDILEAVLERVQTIKNEGPHEWEIMTTVIDTLPHPELSDYLGIDLHGNINLSRKYGASVQIEDPGSDWTLIPDRYTQLGKTYRWLFPDQSNLIDINIVNIHPPTQLGFPTDRQVGTEIFQMAHAAENQAGRVVFYAESQLRDMDWEVLPFTTAANVIGRREGKKLLMNAPTNIIFQGPPNLTFDLDGSAWPCQSQGEIWIPAGEHALSVSEQPSLPSGFLLQMTHFGSELTGCRATGREFVIDYRSQSRCSIGINKIPNEIYLDHHKISPEIIKTENGCILFFPPGQHQIQLLN